MAFFGCEALTMAIIGNGIETIQSYTFSGCDALERVLIGENVTTILEGAFYTNTTPITKIICMAQNPPALHEEAFQPTEYGIATLYVPNVESMMAYQQAAVWENFNKIEIVNDYILGVDDIIGDVDNIAPVEYFNLQGVKVDRPEPSSIYIVKQGNKVSKILVK